MNKAILVIDMPSNCNGCYLRHHMTDGLPEDWCGVNKKEVIPEAKNRPVWCPLKPAPEKIDVPDWDDDIKAQNKNAEEVGMYMYDRGHYRGYNICIDKILGK